MLIVNGLQVDRGGAHILDGLSLSAKKGQVVLLTGRNGSGKSTALLAIAGRLPILSGTIEWTDGPKPVGERRRPRCGLLLQGGRVFPSMKVRENLEIAGMGLPPAVFAKRLETLFTQLPQLRPLEPKCAGVLSGGERQVVALAMVLLREPEVLLLDEPLAGVDGSNAASLLKILAEIKRGATVAMVIVEHRLSLLGTISDATITLDGGGLPPTGSRETSPPQSNDRASLSDL